MKERTFFAIATWDERNPTGGTTTRTINCGEFKVYEREGATAADMESEIAQRLGGVISMFGLHNSGFVQGRDRNMRALALETVSVTAFKVEMLEGGHVKHVVKK